MQMFWNVFIQIMGIITPYIVLIVTLAVQSYRNKKKEVPLLRCNVKRHPAFDNRSPIVIITNVSNYTAFDIKVTPKLEIWSDNNVHEDTNILYPNNCLQFIIRDKDEDFNIVVEYKDAFHKKHVVKYSIMAKECGDIFSDFQVTIKTEIEK